MLEFILVTVTLMGLMISCHKHFSKRAKDRVKEEERRFSEEWASAWMRDMEKLEKKYPGSKEPPPDEIERFLTDYMTSFFDSEKMKAHPLAKAYKTRCFVNIVSTFIAISAVLFLLSGVLQYLSYSEYASVLIAGVVFLMLAIIQIWEIERRL